MLYILSWAFCLALLLAVYKIFLSGTTFHRFNRILLLVFLAVSAVLPLCHIETEFDSMSIADSEFVRTRETFQGVQADAEGTNAVESESVAVGNHVQQAAESEAKSAIWPYLLVGVYMFYVLIILSGWARSTFKMRRFLRSCRR